jgi:hypothetical protein
MSKSQLYKLSNTRFHALIIIKNLLDILVNNLARKTIRAKQKNIIIGN